jgi:hypothetical protein
MIIGSAIYCSAQEQWDRFISGPFVTCGIVQVVQVQFAGEVVFLAMPYNTFFFTFCGGQNRYYYHY